jgi:hypothetical protein
MVHRFLYARSYTIFLPERLIFSGSGCGLAVDRKVPMDLSWRRNRVDAGADKGKK